MKHSVFGKKLSRTKNERRRLLQGLVRDLILRGKIVTTITKAKAVRPLVEKLITKAKRGDRTAFRAADQVIADRFITAQLFADAKTRFTSRNSGFTRVVKLGQRAGDGAEEVVLEFVDQKVVTDVIAPAKTAEKKKEPAGKSKKPAAPKKTQEKKKTTKKPVKARK